MKKILYLIGSIGIFSSTTLTIVSCNKEPGSTEKPIVKQDLTTELLNTFLEENTDINYNAPFIFNQDMELTFENLGNNEFLIGHLALETFYETLNKNFNYKDFSFLFLMQKLLKIVI